MGAQAKQLNLFAAAQPAAASAAPDAEAIRRDLQYWIWIVRTAEVIPWRAAKMEARERLFAELAALIPDGEALLAEFETELKRLRAA